MRPLHIGSAVVMAAVLALGTGCSGADDNPSPNGRGSMTPSSSGSSPSPSEDPRVTEAKDRDAAIKAYTDRNQAWLDAHDQPESEWRATLSKYMVDPALASNLRTMEEQKERGYTLYGEPASDVTLPEPINGADRARLRDCRNESHYGVEDENGNKLTVGPPYSFTTWVDVVRTDSGAWKVQKITLTKKKCGS